MKLLPSILTFLILSTTSAQNKTSNTRLTIIGTIHTGNKHFDHKTLFKILKEINPDVILQEQSIEYNRVFGLLTGNFLKIWSPSIEDLAVQKYTRFNKKCKVLPYDIFINDRLKYKSEININKDKIFEGLKIKHSENFITGNDILEFANYASIRTDYYNKIWDTTLERINRKDITEMTRIIYNLEKSFIQKLAIKYVTDTTLVNWFTDYINFWNKRNTYMSKKILSYAELYRGKNIVVLTGLDHKYYLLDKIKESNIAGLEIIEFVQYQN